MSANKSPLTTLKSLYTDTSRHQESLAIITNNADRLKPNLLKHLDMEMYPFKVSRESKLGEISPPERERINHHTENLLHDNKQDFERDDYSR